jgi:predicted permease
MSILRRITNLLRRSKLDQEIEAELRSHIEMRTADNIAAGMSPDEARRQTLLRFGSRAAMKERVIAADAQMFLDSLWQDLCYGLRQLRRNPGFAAIAILTLALGIGANSAIFSVVNALFLHLAGIAHPDQVVVERARYIKLGLNNIVVSVPDYAQMRDSTKLFASAALEQDSDFNYMADSYPVDLQGARVTWQWFGVFGAKPILGRTFTAAEDQPNANHEVFLSYGAWERWFGSDRNAIGRTVQLNQQPYRIIGVMGRDFLWPNPQDVLWVPIGLDPRAFSVDNTFSENYLAVARLQPGVTFAQANSYMGILTQRVWNNPATKLAKNAQWSMFLMPFADYVFGDLRTPILILGGAAAFVLLIACSNIAGLLLAKATGRSKELAVRAALGASRRRLIAQALGESFVLGVLGVAAGLLIAVWGLKALLFAAPKDLATGMTFPLDGYVLGFTALVGIVAVMTFGSFPAWRMSRANPYDALREAGRSSMGSHARQNFRSWLVAGELALGLVLLAGTSVLLKSLSRIGEVNPGFNPHGLMTASLSLPKQQYDNDDKRSAFFRTVLDRLRNAPGVTDAGEGDEIPFSGENSSSGFEIQGKLEPAGSPGPHGDNRLVTPGYFAALGIPLLKGRLFTDDDCTGSQYVAMIDDNLARQYWPTQNPIGQKIKASDTYGWATIVGIVGHIRFSTLVGEESSSAMSQSSSKGVFYFCTYQMPKFATGGFLMAKSKGSAASAEAAIREAVRSVDPSLPLTDFSTMDARIADSLGPQRFATNLLAVFAALAILLAAVGLYGLISYSVTQRTNEFGIRMALGARPTDVLRLVLRQASKLSLIGAGVGIIAGILLIQTMRSVLYDVSSGDPLSFIGAATLLMLISLVASYLPARRAMRVDPMVALRYE